MKLQCQFEQDLIDAVASHRWPDRAETALRDHVGACRICADVADIAAAFFDDRERAIDEAPVPPASVIWWKAQIRARDDAARLAARPIVLVQVLATICASAVSIAAAPAASAWVRKSLTSLGAASWWTMPADANLSWILSAAAYTTFPLLAVGVWVVLAPVVVYLALDE